MVDPAKEKVWENDLEEHPLVRKLLSLHDDRRKDAEARATGGDRLLARTSSFSKIVYVPAKKPADARPAASIASEAPAEAVDDPLRRFGAILLKIGILLSRSSGRDKAAAFFQYGSLFFGRQPWVAVDQSKNAVWRKVEESMSSGRKVMRLMKWIKEFERAKRSAEGYDPHPFEGAVERGFARIVATCMHFGSFMYYFSDNLVWASQVGLINRPSMDVQSPSSAKFSSSSSASPSMSDVLSTYEEHVRVHDMASRTSKRVVRSKAMESNFQSTKIYASGIRLILSFFYCTAGIAVLRRAIRVSKDAIRKVQHEIEKRNEESSSLDVTIDSSRRPRLVSVAEEPTSKGVERKQSLLISTDQERWDDYVAVDDLLAKAEKERESVSELELQIRENYREMVMSGCNLGILLQRNGVIGTPVWLNGVWGMLSAVLAVDKNWPVAA